MTTLVSALCRPSSIFYGWRMLLLPWAAGWWFDRDGSYEITLWLSLITALMSAIFYMLMRRPNLPARLHEDRNTEAGDVPVSNVTNNASA